MPANRNGSLRCRMGRFVSNRNDVLFDRIVKDGRSCGIVLPPRSSEKSRSKMTGEKMRRKEGGGKKNGKGEGRKENDDKIPDENGANEARE